jgi:nicotinamidase-related amidase
MNRAMLVVDMQNGFCHPHGSFTRIDMGLSIEVLSSYQLAEIASITEGFDVGAAEVPIGV